METFEKDGMIYRYYDSINYPNGDSYDFWSVGNPYITGKITGITNPTFDEDEENFIG